MNDVRMSSIDSMRQLGGDFGSGVGAGCAVAASVLKRDLIRTSLLSFLTPFCLPGSATRLDERHRLISPCTSWHTMHLKVVLDASPIPVAAPAGVDDILMIANPANRAFFCLLCGLPRADRRAYAGENRIMPAGRRPCVIRFSLPSAWRSSRHFLAQPKRAMRR
jgi:hypothetical protein